MVFHMVIDEHFVKALSARLKLDIALKPMDGSAGKAGTAGANNTSGIRIVEKSQDIICGVANLQDITGQDVITLVVDEERGILALANKSFATLMVLLVALVLVFIVSVGLLWEVSFVSRFTSIVREIQRVRQDGHHHHRVQVQGQDEFTTLAVDINKMLEALEKRTNELRNAQASLIRSEKMATIGQLTATVSHELRNPLATVHGTIANLEMNIAPGTEQTTRQISRIKRNVDRCHKIINDLLDFSKTSESDREETTLDAWLEGVFRELAHPAWLSFQFLPGTDGTQVPLDQDRIRRVVINLYENAVQALESTMENGNGGQRELTVRTKLQNGNVEIVFEDNGPGISENVMDRIFEPLFSTKTYGTGLGLPTVKNIMEQEGGGVSIHSSGNEGTQASIWLPIAGKQGEERRVS